MAVTEYITWWLCVNPITVAVSCARRPEKDEFNSRMLPSILGSAGLLPALPAAVTTTQEPNIKAENLVMAEGNLTKKLMKLLLKKSWWKPKHSH